MRQITASKVGLLLQCARPFAPDVECERDEPGEAALYGTALHAILAGQDAKDIAALSGFDETELRAHAERVIAAEDAFLDGANEWQIKWEVRGREVSYGGLITEEAVVHKTSVRLDIESHSYELLHTPDSRALYGTCDASAISSDGSERLVIDYKTGRYVEPRADTPQMLTLASLFDARYVAIIHAPRGEPVRIYQHEIRISDKVQFERALALQAARIGDGSMRPGPECHYCPAQGSCPAALGEDVAAASGALVLAGAALVPAAPGELAIAPTKGAMHLLAAKLETLLKRVREDIRNAVINGEVVERPDGKILVATTSTRENLSKTSVIRALGKVEGERVLAELRERGAIEVSEVTEVRAK